MGSIFDRYYVLYPCRPRYNPLLRCTPGFTTLRWLCLTMLNRYTYMFLCGGALSIRSIHRRSFQGAEASLRSERPRREKNAGPLDHRLHLRHHPHRYPVSARLCPLQFRPDELQPLRLQHQIETGVWHTHQTGQPDPELAMRLSYSAFMEFIPRVET